MYVRLVFESVLIKKEKRSISLVVDIEFRVLPGILSSRAETIVFVFILSLLSAFLRSFTCWFNLYNHKVGIRNYLRDSFVLPIRR